MSEVAVVAAITGGASVLTSGITAAVTYSVSKNSSRVELAKVNAENDRLRQSNREDERRNRQSTYHNFIDVLNGIYQLLGMKIKEAEEDEVFTNYHHLAAGAMLFGPPSVRNRVGAVSGVYNRIWDELRDEQKNHPERSEDEHWAAATRDLRDEFKKCVNDLIQVMHEDVTQGIIDHPQL